MSGKILLPPSPNWFMNNAVDSRTEDELMVSASFKAVVIYQITQESLPKILKVIPFGYEKVNFVSLYPEASHKQYGKYIACCGDGPSLKLVSMETGHIKWQHSVKQDKVVTGLAWGKYGEEPAVVCVDTSGRLMLWQPEHGLTKIHKFHQINDITCLAVNPNDRTQAVIAGNKSILLCDLKEGNIQMQFQGHNYDVYCMKWFVGESSPICDSVETESAHENGSENEKGKPNKGSDSDNWRNKPKVSSSSSSGPFIASSDFGRQIFLWDLCAKRYITKATVPVSASAFNKKFQGKEKVTGKQHVTLLWTNKGLVSSTPKGELLLWKLWPGGGKCSVLYHLHNRAVYNAELVGQMLITCGQDRVIQGYNLSTNTHIFQYPTLGACASAFSFCPHDINRLAVGSQESAIRLINFESEIPLQVQTVWQNIKGKILSMAWHPQHEGRLLFGTGSGQVGFVDMASGQVTTFAYYHQKSVYKVEWAPRVCPKGDSSDAYCAYSFGDREIVIRSASNAMADPVQLLPLLIEKNDNKNLKDVTEFAFSCDHKYFAVGCNDGQVHIYQSSDLKLKVSLFVLRKAIQHLLWQPPSSASFPDVLAVGSNEDKICIFDLTIQLQKDTLEVEVLTQATRELCGHESRIVWLSWSPHQSEIIASASYDHTVQIWNANTGEALANYGGHTQRTFRVEFSPSDPDLMYSFAEENSIHMWRPSELLFKTPSESLAKNREERSKRKEIAAAIEEVIKKEDPTPQVEKNSTGSNVASEKSSSNSGNTMFVSNKKNAYKSFFPKLHSVTSRKKSFNHIVIMNLLAQRKLAQDHASAGGDQLDEELSDELDESTNTEVGEDKKLATIDQTTKDYSFILEKETAIPESQDIAYALSIYGKPLEMDALLTSEISEHGQKGNEIQADLMHCWKGSVDTHVREAARNKKLTPFLVASAPQVSVKLWELACEAYSEQLVEEGDIISAATYLVNINKIENAVDLLIKNRFYREAMSIAKCRLGYNEELIQKITLAWAATSVFEGSFDISATLHISLGQIEEAARAMARRNDHGSLFIASQLYSQAGKKDLAKSLGLLAVKEACMKSQFDKAEKFLLHLPELEWFLTILCSHEAITKIVQQVASKNSDHYNMEVEHPKEMDTDNKGDSESTVCSSSSEKFPLLHYLRQEWSRRGFKDVEYPKLYETVKDNLSTQQTPLSVKQLWFLVSVAITELMLSPSPDLWEQHLLSALTYTMSWGKADQIYHLTHLLLPKGPSDLSTVSSACVEAIEDSNKAIILLHMLYHISELCSLHMDMQNNMLFSPLTNGHEEKEKEIVDCTESLTEKLVISDQKESRIDSKEDVIVETVDVKQEDQVKESSDDEQSNKTHKESATQILERLRFFSDFLISHQDSHNYLEKVVESLSSEPKKMLLDLSVKLKESGFVKDEDVQLLICKISSLKR